MVSPVTHPERAPDRTTELPLVTAVVPTYNRAGLLADCLRSLDALRYPRDRLEIIVIDDGSRDQTENVLKEFSRRGRTTLRWMRQENQGPATARNHGVDQAQGELVAFTDDDCVVDPNWLGELARSFTGADVAGVGGAICSGSPGVISEYMELHHIIASDVSGRIVPPFLVTANACFRKQTLVAVGGFDTRFRQPGGEDPDLCWRILQTCAKLVTNPDAVVYHHHKQTLRQFYRMFYNYGRGQAYLDRKHGLAGQPNSAGGREAILRARLLLYRAKQYWNRSRVGPLRALFHSGLDEIRAVAFQRGYRQSEACEIC